jgi:hypothetical protein
MRKIVLAAAIAAASVSAASAADGVCYSPAESQAKAAILFQTNLMVASTSCHDLTYARFRLRNRVEIIHYQNVMIGHFRRAGARSPAQSFESWITELANDDAGKMAGLTITQACQQAAGIFQIAATLDGKGFQAYAASHAATDAAEDRRCRR